MRSILLIFATILLVAVGFFVYLWIQPSQGPGQAGPVVVMAPGSRPTEVPDPDRAGGNGPSKNVWIKVPDEKTGALSQEFRAVSLEPQKDGTVNVDQPQARIYLGARSNTDGQVLMIRGRTGKVVVPDSPNQRRELKGTATPPSRGQLHDVIIDLFESAESTEPILTCTMNNASFDQETYRIQTESYEFNGKIIPADQVEVKVRGRDYDFDGRGLDIRWNERDRRLQLLEVAHGERLVIKHPQALHSSLQAPSTAPTASSGPCGEKPIDLVRPARFAADHQGALLPMLVSANPSAAGDVIKQTPPAAPHPSPAFHRKRKPATVPAVAPVKIVRDTSDPIYQATFLDNVKIVQSGSTLATANEMLVGFVMDSASSTTQPTSQPTTLPSGQPVSHATTVSATTAPSKSLANVNRPPRTRPATTTVANHPKPVAPTTARAATTQPADEPITIFWTGKLTVVPYPTADTDDDPPTKEDQIITLIGEPVVLTKNTAIRADGTQGTSRVECALARYRTLDSSLLLDHSSATPIVVMRDEKGSVLRTPNLEYDGGSGVAELTGVSTADVVMKSDSTTQPTTAPAVMHASWTKICRVFLAGNVKEDMTIDRAEIEGDVTVDHPQLKGRSDFIAMTFAQSASTKPADDTAGAKPEPELKTVDSKGSVHYVLNNEQKSETIDCGHLTLGTAKDQNQKMYAQSMFAEDNVHAFDATQDLKCGKLKLSFLPSTRPSTQPADPSKLDTSSIIVQTVDASDNVRIVTNTGNSANSDQLKMRTIDGKREVTLVGKPMAHLQQKEDSLDGPVIVFDPDTDRAAVTGGGTMHAVQAPSPDAKSKTPQPMDMTFAGNLNADGNLNTVQINDKIAITAKSSDGAMNRATSERLNLVLMDDPATTKPTTQPATQATTQPTTKKAAKDSALTQAGFGDSTFFKDKVVKTVRLEDNVRISSVLNDAAGKLMRRLLLLAPTVEYQVPDKVFVVPSPGSMLMQDVSKKPTTAPTAGAPVAAGNPTGNDMHGATAIEWGRELRYDELQRRVNIDGAVHIEHEASADAKPFSLRAESIVADLEPVPPADPTSQPATKPAGTSPTEEKMRLKHVTATNHVEFISAPVHFEATSIDYDPNTHELIAYGSDRNRAELYDDKGSVRGTFTELHYNTQTGQIEKTLNLRTIIRK